jgi:hypothetical protein
LKVKKGKQKSRWEELIKRVIGLTISIFEQKWSIDLTEAQSLYTAGEKAKALKIMERLGLSVNASSLKQGAPLSDHQKAIRAEQRRLYDQWKPERRTEIRRAKAKVPRQKKEAPVLSKRDLKSLLEKRIEVAKANLDRTDNNLDRLSDAQGALDEMNSIPSADLEGLDKELISRFAFNRRNLAKLVKSLSSSAPSNLPFLIATSRFVGVSKDSSIAKKIFVMGLSFEIAFLKWVSFDPSLGVVLFVSFYVAAHYFFELFNDNYTRGSPYQSLSWHVLVFGLYFALSPLYYSHPTVFLIPAIVHALTDAYRAGYFDRWKNLRFKVEWIPAGPLAVLSDGSAVSAWSRPHIRLWLEQSVLMSAVPTTLNSAAVGVSTLPPFDNTVPQPRISSLESSREMRDIHRQLRPSNQGGIAFDARETRSRLWMRTQELAFGGNTNIPAFVGFDSLPKTREGLRKRGHFRAQGTIAGHDLRVGDQHWELPGVII